MNEKKVKNSILFNVFLLALVFLVGYGSFRAVRQATNLKKESQEDKQKIDDLLRQKGELEEKIAELQTRESLERTAKENLNLKNPDENVVVVLPPERQNAPATSSPEETRKNGWWGSVKEFFKKIF